MSLLAGLGGGTAARPKVRARSGHHWWLLGPGLVYLLLFFLVPVVLLLVTSLKVPVAGAEHGEYAFAMHWQNYGDALSQFWRPLVRSFGFAAIATLFALAVGYPMAYAIAVRARTRPLLQGLLLVLVIAPFFTSFILRTWAWRQILADQGPVVSALQWWHILPADGRLSATPFAVVWGLVYSFLPFMVLPIFANLGRLDPRMLEAGADLYASPFTTFRKVTFPLSLPGVVSGTLLVFIPASGDYVNSSLLGNSTNAQMIGQVIDARFLNLFYPTATALSTILMVAILVLVTTYVRRSGTEDLL
ncbi:MAG: ABC transporter permease [Micrococcales bacterium]|nr:ABC transporter permease [Micrococcales bacterium]